MVRLREAEETEHKKIIQASKLRCVVIESYQGPSPCLPWERRHSRRSSCQPEFINESECIRLTSSAIIDEKKIYLDHAGEEGDERHEEKGKLIGELHFIESML